VILMDENYPFEYDDESVREPRYKGYTINPVYITVRDGVKLAMDVYLPKGLENDKKVPTVLVQTRYWRSFKFKWPIKWLMKPPRKPWIVKNLCRHGLAVAWADVRGTGASYGTRPYPFSEEEIKDGAELTSWIVSQPWSDGNVVTYGNSYSGVTSELTAVLNHPAIKCIVTKHNPWDMYLHASFPGGCYCKGFINHWTNLGKALDTTEGKQLKIMKPYDKLYGRIAPLAVRSVLPVESEGWEETLNEIKKIHEGNKHPGDYFERVKTRDDPLNEEGATIDLLSTFSKKQMIENAGVPMYTWGSWQDSTTANAVILRFLNFSNPQKVVITDGCHRDKFRANPFHHHKKAADPHKADQVSDWVKFYRDCLSNKFGSKKILYYYTMGEEKWKKTETWPPANQEMVRWYLKKDNSLSQIEPQEELGSDDYTIDYESTTGIRNRWYTLLSLPINYPDRDKADQQLLCYTSEPLEEDIEITGHPIVNLFLKSTHEDGMVNIHFEFLDEKGKIHWVTDGQIRLVHRKLSTETPPYKIITPYHSYKRQDMEPMIPGEVAEVKFALYPTSIVLRQGYRMRICIGGADKETFARYPDEGTPTITIEHNKVHASSIELPIIQQKE